MGRREMRGDMAVDSTSDYQMSEPNRLKEWRYRKRTQARKDRRRAKRRQKKEREATERQEITTYYIFIFLALLRFLQMVSPELRAAIHLLNHLLYQYKHLPHDKRNRS